MSKLYTTKDESMERVLMQIGSGEIQLPEFQRDWRWEMDRIKPLIASILNSYPIGGLLFLENKSDSEFFQSRKFTGTYGSMNSENLVMDGQQRLTSIYCSMFSKRAAQIQTGRGKLKYEEFFFYVNIAEPLSSNIERVDTIISVDKEKSYGSIKLSSREKEFENHLFPLNIIFDWDEITKWRTGYLRFHRQQKKIINIWNKFEMDTITLVNKYQIPITILDKSTPPDVICHIFENVNRGGMVLTVFEFLTAIYMAQNFNLRDDWEKQRKKIEGRIEWIVNDSWKRPIVDSKSFLTALTLFTTCLNHKNGMEEKVSGSHKSILNLRLEDYKKNVDCMTEAFINVGIFLQELCIFSERDVPYTSQIIPMACIFAMLGKRVQNVTIRKKLSTWFFCGVLGEMYGDGAESRSVSDLQGFLKWVENDDYPPNAVHQAIFSPLRLLDLQTRGSAAYKGIMALILQQRPKDFISGREIAFSVFSEEAIDLHHIFPVKYCKKKEIARVLYNSIINKTPISKYSNQKISGFEPSVYLKRIAKIGGLNNCQIDGVLESHFINTNAIRSNNFKDFFFQRGNEIIDLISKAMGKPIQNFEDPDIAESVNILFKT